MSKLKRKLGYCRCQICLRRFVSPWGGNLLVPGCAEQVAVGPWHVSMPVDMLPSKTALSVHCLLAHHLEGFIATCPGAFILSHGLERHASSRTASQAQ